MWVISAHGAVFTSVEQMKLVSQGPAVRDVRIGETSLTLRNGVPTFAHCACAAREDAGHSERVSERVNPVPEEHSLFKCVCGYLNTFYLHLFALDVRFICIPK